MYDRGYSYTAALTGIAENYTINILTKLPEPYSLGYICSDLVLKHYLILCKAAGTQH